MADFMTPDEHIAQYDWPSLEEAKASRAAKVNTSYARRSLMQHWEQWLAYNESAMFHCAGITPKEGFGSMTPLEQFTMFYHWLGGCMEAYSELLDENGKQIKEDYTVDF